MVSRFLASRLWSKVPVKAKAHESGEGQSIRGGGVGGAPPPRTGFASAKYPTSSHSATQISSDVPLRLGAVIDRTQKRGVCREFSVGGNSPADRARAAGRRADPAAARGLAAGAAREEE